MKVLYIAGHGRSGSTLLERMLGQLEEFEAVGELRHLFRRGLDENQLCGCGSKFMNCGFWQRVVERAFGSRDAIPLHELQELKHRVDRTRYVPQMFFAREGSRYRNRFNRYSEVCLNLYRAINHESGGKIILDSSKDTSSLYLLARQPEIDLHVVHLIRDSRAVAFSWLRKKVRPEVTWETAYMPRFSSGRTALEWLVRNTLVEFSRSFVTSYRRIRYEDMVADPKRTIERITADLISSIPDLSMFSGRSVSLTRSNHTVAGNPMRFKSGQVQIREDREWEVGMARGVRNLVTCLTAPGLLRYGYPLFPKPRVGEQKATGSP